MSEYYNAQRTKNIYDPSSKEPYKLSRSKIDDFLKCPRCFYIDRRLGTGQPQGYPLNLNSAVDELLKKEFDVHRAANKAHPLMEAYGLDAVPFVHEKMDEWRDSLRRGITYLHTPTNLLITGGVDDVWADNKTGELIIVDYKATSKDGEVGLDADWQIGYKRQMEIYQWLFRQNGFKVSSTGYFVYCNGRRDNEAFDGRLDFDIKLIPYTGDDSWVEKAVIDAHRCLNSETIPEAGEHCDYCNYFEARKKLTEHGKD
jgi:CRISPR/Cas system-associated exonuclease Cas4 (RecB family)